MNIPKKTIQKLIANYIGSSVFNGVHWFNYITNDNLDKLIEQIKQVIIGTGNRPDEVLTTLYNSSGKTCIFNPKVVQKIAYEMFSKLEDTNKVKVRYTDLLDIENSKEEEIKFMSDFIKNSTESNLDVFLYKMDGPREKNIIFHENGDKYKMIIHGFYLIEKDIEKVNLELSKYDKKIYTLEKKEMMDPFLGIRYSLQIGGADFVK